MSTSSWQGKATVTPYCTMIHFSSLATCFFILMKQAKGLGTQPLKTGARKSGRYQLMLHYLSHFQYVQFIIWVKIFYDQKYKNIISENRQGGFFTKKKIKIKSLSQHRNDKRRKIAIVLYKTFPRPELLSECLLQILSTT